MNRIDIKTSKKIDLLIYISIKINKSKMEYQTSYKLTAKSDFDKMLEKRGMLYEIPEFYLGNIINCAICIDPETNIEELHDINDIISSVPLSVGTEITVSLYNKTQKSIIFQRGVRGIFYKWRTYNGLYLILTQQEVNLLSKKEKRILRMKL